jgi:hypothetical protein
VSAPGGESRVVPLEWIHCEDGGGSCEFSARIQDGDLGKTVTIAAVDGAGNLDRSPVRFVLLQPENPFEECPFGPLCD